MLRIMSFTGIKMSFAHNRNISERKKIKIDSIVEQDLINYNSVPSLESIAITNLATELCKQSDIKDAILQYAIKFNPFINITCLFYLGISHSNSFGQLEESILNKLSLVPLPNLLKTKVANVVKPVLIQILEWVHFNRKKIGYMDTVYWTNDGTIDKIKTLKKQLVHNDSAQYIDDLYELACKYCLEDSIPNLWGKLPEKAQKHYLNSKTIYCRTYDYHLVAYWTSVIKNDLSGLFHKIKPSDSKDIYNYSNSVYKNMFALAILQGNILAVKYFWNRLTDEEISYNLAQWINDTIQNVKDSKSKYQKINKYSDVLYFLLSQIDDAKQQKEVLQKNSAVILKSLFLDWPWQRFLLPTIQTIWSSLDEEVYVTFLSRIAEDIKVLKTSYKLLRELWQQSPINLKKHFIQRMSSFHHHCHIVDVLCNLLTVGDLETVKLILNYANVEEKKQIIFSMVKNDKICDIISADNLSVFDILIAKILSSETDVHNLKAKIILTYGSKLCHDWIVDENWQMIENFFDWAFTSQDQIHNFKNKILTKFEITDEIIRNLGNYELADKFVSWCFSNEQEINQFKKYFAEFSYKRLMLGNRNWDYFEKLINWCFISDEDVNKFKFYVLHSAEISVIIFRRIAFENNINFVDNLICWCCHSDEEIKQFKKVFIFSETWINILQELVRKFKVHRTEYDNWKMLQKFIKYFLPLEMEEIINLKKRITSLVKFDNYRKNYRPLYIPVKKKDLFRLIDNCNKSRKR